MQRIIVAPGAAHARRSHAHTSLRAAVPRSLSSQGPCILCGVAWVCWCFPMMMCAPVPCAWPTSILFMHMSVEQGSTERIIDTALHVWCKHGLHDP